MVDGVGGSSVNFFAYQFKIDGGGKDSEQVKNQTENQEPGNVLTAGDTLTIVFLAPDSVKTETDFLNFLGNLINPPDTGGTDGTGGTNNNQETMSDLADKVDTSDSDAPTDFDIAISEKSDLMSRVAELLADVAATNADLATVFEANSVNDINRALELKKSAHAKQVEAAGIEKESAIETAKMELIAIAVTFAFQAIGSALSAYGSHAGDGANAGKFAKFAGPAGDFFSGLSGSIGTIIKSSHVLTTTAELDEKAKIANADAGLFQAEASYAESMAQRMETSANNMTQAAHTALQQLQSLNDILNNSMMSLAQNLRS